MPPRRAPASGPRGADGGLSRKKGARRGGRGGGGGAAARTRTRPNEATGAAEEVPADAPPNRREVGEAFARDVLEVGYVTRALAELLAARVGLREEYGDDNHAQVRLQPLCRGRRCALAAGVSRAPPGPNRAPTRLHGWD